MPAEKRYTEAEVLQEGLTRLRHLMGSDWDIQPVSHGATGPDAAPGSGSHSTVYAVTDPLQNRSGPILVEVKLKLTPADVAAQLAPRLELMRQLTGDAAILILSPWLSPRARQRLDELGYGYLDLTGNVAFRLNRPSLSYRLEGAKQAPTPQLRGERSLRGEKAGTLIRALIDVPPPHRAVDLSAATELSLAYVSRLLDSMQSEALLKRSGRLVTEVDWVGLIRARSATYDLLRANPPVAMVAPKGTADTIRRLAERINDVETSGRVAVTGSVAAAQIAPLTVGGQLMMHVEDLDAALGPIGRNLGLLPATDGGNVLLLDTATASVFFGRRRRDGIPHVAPSQLVLDCLGGSGRMPAEGEAVLDVMRRHESDWRKPTLEAWAFRDR